MDGIRPLADVVAKRRQFLSTLSERPRSKPDLVCATGMSRSTVDRAISDLTDHGLVTRDGHVFRPTYTGICTLNLHESYLDRLSDIARADDVLGDLPPDAEVDPAILDGADVRSAEPHAQDYPVRPTLQVVERAERLRAVSPVVMPQYVDAVRGAASDGGVDLDLVCTPAVVDTIERHHAEAIRECIDAGLTLYESETAPPYALWAADTGEGRYGGLIVHSETGVQGAIQNDTDAMNEWARETVAAYRSEATEITL